MTINVDLASEVPIYQQPRDQFVETVADGVLTEGSPLPATRALAADFEVAPAAGDHFWSPQGERS